MRITKKMEAKEDYTRYRKILEKTEDPEDRSFFISGVLNIDKKHRNDRFTKLVEDKSFVWEMYNIIENSHYSYQAIANFCDVDLVVILEFMKGEFPNKRQLKKILVGIEVYGI